jgi:hypothetical protein
MRSTPVVVGGVLVLLLVAALTLPTLELTGVALMLGVLLVGWVGWRIFTKRT